MGYNVSPIDTTVSSNFTNLSASRVRTTGLNVGELLTSEGLRFSQTFDNDMTNGETKYFLYQVPSNSLFTVALQNRLFKSDKGSVDIEILWDSTGFTAGALVKTFNEYNKYTDNSALEISEITAPTVEGVIRETDFLTSSGSGSKASGGVSSDLGFRLYQPDTFFIAKVTNTHNSNNRVILSYSWVEIPLTELRL